MRWRRLKRLWQRLHELRRQALCRDATDCGRRDAARGATRYARTSPARIGDPVALLHAAHTEVEQAFKEFKFDLAAGVSPTGLTPRAVLYKLAAPQVDDGPAA